MKKRHRIEVVAIAMFAGDTKTAEQADAAWDQLPEDVRKRWQDRAYAHLRHQGEMA